MDVRTGWGPEGPEAIIRNYTVEGDGHFTQDHNGVVHDSRGKAVPHAVAYRVWTDATSLGRLAGLAPRQILAGNDVQSVLPHDFHPPLWEFLHHHFGQPVEVGAYEDRELADGAGEEHRVLDSGDGRRWHWVVAQHRATASPPVLRETLYGPTGRPVLSGRNVVVGPHGAMVEALHPLEPGGTTQFLDASERQEGMVRSRVDAVTGAPVDIDRPYEHKILGGFVRAGVGP
jgi:hypothetical protein